jgi:hypothetical protein
MCTACQTGVLADMCWEATHYVACISVRILKRELSVMDGAGAVTQEEGGGGGGADHPPQPTRLPPRFYKLGRAGTR